MAQLSRFNHIHPWRDGYHLAFNAGSGALALITQANYATYQRLAAKLDNGSSGSLEAEEEELLSQLRYGHFVVDGESSELDWLKFRYRKVRFDTSSLGLVLAPTMACNMACPYCFEDNKRGRMSPRTVEALIGFVERQASGLKEVQTTWYGGEPLLALDIMEDITASMHDLAGEHGFTYTCSGVISNGYLLDEKATERLRDLKVGQVQVTIDGPARIHDRKRPLKNGLGSFGTILRNVTYAADRLPIVIRINLDKSFTPGIVDELLSELEGAGLRNKATVYFGQLEPATTTCANIAESCYETRAFSQTEIAYYRLLLDRGFYVQKLPHPIMTFCFAQLSNSFLIDPQGDLFRCFNYAGDPTRSMGNIQDAVNYRHPQFGRLFAFDPFEHPSCRSCDILPICMGSCPSRRVDRGVGDQDICDSWKYNLQPMLELVALSRQQQARSAAAVAAKETTS
jgi:uncharacterized protein